MTRLRTPVARARGLGSARDGTHHWIAQRLTAVMLVPLCIWFAGSMIGMTDATHPEFVAWLARPLNTALMLLLIVGLFWHSMLGLQVVVEDYIHSGWLKVSTLVVLKLAHALLAIASLYAVLGIGLGVTI